MEMPCEMQTAQSFDVMPSSFFKIERSDLPPRLKRFLSNWTNRLKFKSHSPKLSECKAIAVMTPRNLNQSIMQTKMKRFCSASQRIQSSFRLPRSFSESEVSWFRVHLVRVRLTR